MMMLMLLMLLMLFVVVAGLIHAPFAFQPSPVASLDSVGGGKTSHYAVPGRHHHMSKKHKVSGYLSSPGEETTV
uniref:Secreted protein n=1 Tax=Octopus bimaculoides TaxID=37653 RepID=A0A0L8IDZ5_OCTBM